MSREKIIVILGPTASGKSDLAVDLAKRFNGEIISADSRQVYKGLDLGSGKVPRDSQSSPPAGGLNSQSYYYRGVPHYLLDVASPKRIFTAQQYQKLGQKAIKKILKKDKIPIICGGTGLYIDALIYNYKFPEVKPNQKLRKKLEKLSNEKLFLMLKKLDPRRAGNIDKNNPRRLIRAIEIAKALGRIPELKKESFYNVLKIGIKKSNTELKKSIKKRLLKRLQIGMVKEVKKLHFNGISWKRLDDFGLEYRFISRYLRGIITKKEMEKLIIKESIKYAKRQMTWFSAKGGSALGGKRNNEIKWIKNQKEAFGFVKKFLLS